MKRLGEVSSIKPVTITRQFVFSSVIGPVAHVQVLSWVDFGNGYYNDHHFHYGYFLTVAAIIAKYVSILKASDSTLMNMSQV